jgi:hypothetical protein
VGNHIGQSVDSEIHVDRTHPVAIGLQCRNDILDRSLNEDATDQPKALSVRFFLERLIQCGENQAAHNDMSNEE